MIFVRRQGIISTEILFNPLKIDRNDFSPKHAVIALQDIFFVKFNNVQGNTISIMLTSSGITTILLKRERVVSMQAPISGEHDSAHGIGNIWK